MMFLILPLLLGAKAQSHDGRVLYKEGFVTVVSPDSVNTEQAGTAAKKTMAAWEFDLGLMRWSKPVMIQGPLTVRLLSDAHVRDARPGVNAYADFSGKRFTIKMSLVDSPRGDANCAHELGHIQAFRVLGERRKFVPRYFIEAHGKTLARLYLDHLRQKDVSSGGKARTILAITSEEARAIFTTGDKYFKGDPKREDQMEMLGAYLVEYMRVYKGILDVVPKMGRVFEEVGRGRTYEQAFRQAYGVSVDQVASELVALFKRTGANPVERLKGTSWESPSPARGDEKSNPIHSKTDE